MESSLDLFGAAEVQAALIRRIRRRGEGGWRINAELCTLRDLLRAAREAAEAERYIAEANK